ncbi:MAG: DHH family phosphoesterase [Longicatena sp.]
MDKLENFKIQVAIIVLAEIAAVVVMYMANIEGVKISPMVILLLFNILIFIWIITKYEKDKMQRYVDISRILGHDAKDALMFGEIGIITYDEQYNVTWVNDFIMQRKIDIVGKKVTSWITDISNLFQGDVDVITAKSEEYVYEITRKENAQVLYVRDVTQLANLKEQYEQDGVVAGLIQLDNYMEIQQYEDESTMATINMQLRQPVIEWAGRYGMFIRRLRSDRFLVIFNESIYEDVVKDKFDILNTIRKNAEEIDVQITLSMSFARGTDDFQLLDDMVNDLLELAQSRGGDQVAVKKYGESVKYYGGSSESREKRSKVRVRVMSQAIKEAISEANRVFVVGHQTMDFDCMGSALCMSRLAYAYGKECYVVSKSGGIEPQLQEALDGYGEKITLRHNFISDEEASKMMEETDLLIAVDHHNPKQSGAPLTLSEANRVIVIDHHRRSEDFITNPLLVYVESSASSACELVTEFLPYQSNKVDISEEEATLMYVGILVDTNRFKMRTGSRTFESAAYLKNLGVDPIIAENMLKEDFDDFEAKTAIMKYARRYNNGLIIAAVSGNERCNRTLMSQAADTLLSIKDVEASFVISALKEGSIAVSARSKGTINVQVIMEKMHGGGHFSAAALQRENTTVMEVENELKEKIREYLDEIKEDSNNESNLVK